VGFLLVLFIGALEIFPPINWLLGFHEFSTSVEEDLSGLAQKAEEELKQLMEKNNATTSNNTTSNNNIDDEQYRRRLELFVATPPELRDIVYPSTTSSTGAAEPRWLSMLGGTGNLRWLVVALMAIDVAGTVLICRTIAYCRNTLARRQPSAAPSRQQVCG
jgi:hypothetical protein